MTGSSASFPKSARLRRRREFLLLQREGRRRHTPNFVVIRAPGRTAQSRLGVTVSSRVGDSVTRNRLKRYVREIFRQRRAALATTVDIVVIAKPGAHTITHAQAATEIELALELAPTR